MLESYSQRLLPLIEWEPTPQFKVRVLNDTGDLYRFFDATPHAEFLYACIRRTIEQNLPDETVFLRRYDQFRQQVDALTLSSICQKHLTDRPICCSASFTRTAAAFRTAPAKRNSPR